MSLRVLNLSNCGLTGSLPKFGASNKKLKVLNLSLNGFDGTIPHSYGDITEIEELIIVSKSVMFIYIRGRSDTTFIVLEMLQSRNKLSGTIIDFGRLQKLVRLNVYILITFILYTFTYGLLTPNTQDNLELYGNALNGTIPKSLTKCSALKRIDLFSNTLSGTIPSEFGAISSLQILHFKVSLPFTCMNTLFIFI